MECEICREVIFETPPTDEEVAINRMANHLWVVHTLPKLEAMLHSHANKPSR